MQPQKLKTFWDQFAVQQHCCNFAIFHMRWGTPFSSSKDAHGKCSRVLFKCTKSPLPKKRADQETQILSLLYLTGSPRPPFPSLWGSFHYWDEAVTQGLWAPRVLSPSLEPGPSAQAFARRMTVRMWKHRTHSRRKDTGVEIIHRGQAGDLHGVGREEPAHACEPALLSVPARGRRTISPLVPLLPHPRFYLQKLENKKYSCHLILTIIFH